MPSYINNDTKDNTSDSLKHRIQDGCSDCFQNENTSVPTSPANNNVNNLSCNLDIPSEETCKNESISVDRLQLPSTDEEKLSLRDVNKITNGTCSMIGSNALINSQKINDDIREGTILHYRDEQHDDVKDANETLNAKNKYNGYGNSNEGVTRGRKRSFMAMARTVPKASQISSETKKETKLARISLCIVWLFIFCHVWKLIPTGYETFFTEDMGVGLNIEWPYWLTIVKEISHSLITINSGLNFLIYIIL